MREIRTTHRSCAHKRAEEESVEEEEEEKRNEPEFVTLGDSDDEVTEKKEEQRPRQRPSRVIKNINTTGRQRKDPPGRQGIFTTYAAARR